MYRKWQGADVPETLEEHYGEDFHRAEAFFQAARKRMGLLGSSIVDIQCFMLAGIYDRAVMRPLQAWYDTEQACSRLLIYLTKQGPLQREASEPASHARQLEQRLYWSLVRVER